MSDQADPIPQNSYQTGSPSTPSSTPPLISSPRQVSVEFYDLPCDLTADFDRPTQYPSVTMTNPANQQPSYDSDAIAKSNSNHFCLPTGHTPAEIERNQVVVKKEERGEEGSKQFTLNNTAATEALKPGFGTAKHFLQRSKDGKEAVAGNTNYTYIQEFFCSNLTKVDSLEHIVSFHVTSRIFSCLESYVMLIRSTL